MSLPTSPIEPKSSSMPPPWSIPLMKSYQENYAKKQEKKSMNAAVSLSVFTLMHPYFI